MTSQPWWRRFRAYRHDIVGYMERWIWQTPWFSVHVHHILRSDADEHLHDHPWGFSSFLLSGGYVEILPEIQPEEPFFLATDPFPGAPTRTVEHRRFSVVSHRATDAHRLVLTKPVWTIVLTSDRLRTWGFWTPAGWVPWKEYEATKHQTSYPRGSHEP